MSKLIELLEKYSISASEEQVLDFEKWLINTTWSKYNEERMNNRIIIENQIKSLGLRFPNGTVGKEYSAKLVIPSGLVDDIWIEGLNDLGLELVPNATTLNECNNCENANVDENINAETQEHAINVSQDDVVTTEQQEAKKDEDIELLISGKPIKSINQYYNKLKADYQSKAILHNGKHITNRTLRLTNKRNHYT